MQFRKEIFKQYDGFLETEEPLIKEISYGTGTGKTYAFLDRFCNYAKSYDGHVIGVYVAPLREHVRDAKQDVARYPDVPVFTALGMNDLIEPEKIDSLYLKWLNNLKHELPLISEDFQAGTGNIVQLLLAVKNGLSDVERFGESDESKERIMDFKRQACGEISRIVKKIVSENKSEDWSKETIKMVEYFIPSFFLKDRSGLILMTTSKFATVMPFAWTTKNKKIVVKDSTWAKVGQVCPNKRIVFALDEFEEFYKEMLTQLTSHTLHGNDRINYLLAAIGRQGDVVFGVSDVEKRANCLVEMVHKGQFVPLTIAYHQEQETGLVGEEVNFELYQLYKELRSDGFSHDEIRFWADYLSTLKGNVRKINEEITARNLPYPCPLDLITVVRIIKAFSEVNLITMSKSLYDENINIRNIFAATENYIYNLKKLHLLSAKRKGTNLSIHTGDGAFTLAELLLSLVAIQSANPKVRRHVDKATDDPRAQDHAISRWRDPDSKVKKYFHSENVQEEKRFLNPKYLFEATKPIYGLVPSNLYDGRLDKDKRELALTASTITHSPDEMLFNMMGVNNSIFVMSATNFGNYNQTTSCDNNYLLSKMHETGLGTFYATSKQDRAITRLTREERGREREVITRTLSQGSSPVEGALSRGAAEVFIKTYVDAFLRGIKEKSFLNKHKIYEINRFVNFMFYAAEQNSRHSLLFVQTWNRYILDFLEQMPENSTNFSIRRSSRNPYIFYLSDLQIKDFSSRKTVKIILYSARFKDGYLRRCNDSFDKELIQKEGENIVVVTAYQSAGKGFNPVVTLEGGQQKDLEILGLLMDPFFSVYKNKIGPDGFGKTDAELGVVFSTLKNCMRSGDAQRMDDLNKYLHSPVALAFHAKQHVFLIAVELMQALGRVERRDFPGTRTEIHINPESANILLRAYKEYSDEHIELMSFNNYHVYQSIIGASKGTIPANYKKHKQDEVLAGVIFKNTIQELLTEIEDLKKQKGFKGDTIKKKWEMLRHPDAIRDPHTFIKNLKKSKMYSESFVDSLFYISPDSTYDMWCCTESTHAGSVSILSDSWNGAYKYPYLEKLWPSFLMAGSHRQDILSGEKNEIDPKDSVSHNNRVVKLWYSLLPKDDFVLKQLIPRPNYFYDILFPSFSENFVKAYIEDRYGFMFQDNFGLKLVTNLPNDMYESFDLFYEMNGTLFCIDVKAWAKVTGVTLSEGTILKATNKISKIKKNHPKYKNVKGLLLNLFSQDEYSEVLSTNLESGVLLYLTGPFASESKVLGQFFS